MVTLNGDQFGSRGRGQPDIGKGWWLTPEGQKHGVYTHSDADAPGVPWQRMSEGHVRVRSYRRQLNVQAVHPFTEAQHRSLLRSAKSHDEIYVDMLHPETRESVFDAHGEASAAGQLLGRAKKARGK